LLGHQNRGQILERQVRGHHRRATPVACEKISNSSSA
jgi:hypothetical protein